MLTPAHPCRDLQPKHLLFCSEGLAWKLIDFSTTVTSNTMVVPEVRFCVFYVLSCAS
jgi:hypothetical protein